MEIEYDIVLGSVYRDRVTGIIGTAVEYHIGVDGSQRVTLQAMFDLNPHAPDRVNTSASMLEEVGK